MVKTIKIMKYLANIHGTREYLVYLIGECEDGTCEIICRCACKDNAERIKKALSRYAVVE